jgi:hypothetical protein
MEQWDPIEHDSTTPMSAMKPMPPMPLMPPCHGWTWILTTSTTQRPMALAFAQAGTGLAAAAGGVGIKPDERRSPLPDWPKPARQQQWNRL